MPLPSYIGTAVPISDKALNGGLNSASGALNLKSNESSDCQNVDFDVFGSVLKRNGYTCLNTGAVYDGNADGLHWYEYDSSGTTTRKAIKVIGNAVYKMDDLDGQWDDITGAITVTEDNHCDFENWLNKVYITNGEDAPFEWDGTATGVVAMGIPTGLTKAKYLRQYNNYMFFGNVTVSGNTHPSRIYFSNLKSTGTWTATDFIEVSLNDGQEITGLKVFKDKLVVYKNRSIYNVSFTGDADIPFVLPNGGKSNSVVGCVAPWSIQEVDNGHVFLSHDGLYFYDGSNSYKLSDKVNPTIDGFNKTRFGQIVSMNYKKKYRYMLAYPESGQTENNKVLIWDYINNAFSIYKGIPASSMSIFYVNGNDERPYFSDYDGYTYRMDIGTNDYPANVQTAIDSYYWTNWKHYDDLCDKKGIPHIYIYYTLNSAVLTFSYSYDFEQTAQYTHTFSTSAGTDVYGTAVYGTGKYSGGGGKVTRRDLTGRGDVVRFKFANSVISETFRIDGFGTLVELETHE